MGTAKGGDLANHAVLPSSSHSLKSFCSTSIFFCRIFLRSTSICSWSVFAFFVCEAAAFFVSFAGSCAGLRRSPLWSSFMSMAPDPSGSNVSNSSSNSLLGAIMPSRGIAWQNSFLVIRPLPSSSHSRKRSITRTWFFCSDAMICSGTGTSDSRSTWKPRRTVPFRGGGMCGPSASCRIVENVTVKRVLARKFGRSTAYTPGHIAPAPRHWGHIACVHARGRQNCNIYSFDHREGTYRSIHKLSSLTLSLTYYLLTLSTVDSNTRRDTRFPVPRTFLLVMVSHRSAQRGRASSVSLYASAWHPSSP